ncbi:MAG: MFS transporter [Desulfobacterales bacterium]|nr:MAG: MFS transporter [Desulfobacterales bacterium]
MSRRWTIFAITSSLFFLSQFYRTSNAVIAPQLIGDLGLDTEGLGLISAAFFYGFAITQIPISLLLDKVGPRHIMTALSLLGIAGAFVFAGADSLSVGLIGRVLMGVGMACNLMGSLKLINEWFGPLVFATLSGILVSIGTLGNMIATTPLVVLVEHVGWRQSFQLIAGVNLILTLIFFAGVRDRPRAGTPGHQDQESSLSLHQAFGNLRVLLNDKDYWIISCATFVRYGVFAAFQALWAGPFLMEVRGYTAVVAGNLIFLVNLGMLLGGPFWGTLSDRLFKTRKWAIWFGLVSLAAIMLALVFLPPDTGPEAMAVFCFGFGLFSAAGLLMYPHIKELMPAGMAGAAMTGINFFTMMGSAVFLQGLGNLMQALYPEASRGPEAFHAAFMLSVACMLGVAGLYLLTKDKMVGPEIP